MLLLTAWVPLAWAGSSISSPGSPSSFIPVEGGPSWWPPVEFVDGTGELLPNPGPSFFAFQFNGPSFGKNYITLPHSLSAELPRSMSIEAWVYVPSAAERDEARKRCATCSNIGTEEPGSEGPGSHPNRVVMPIVSRFNPRMQAGPDNLEAYQDFQLALDPISGQLLFWMGGQYSVDYGVNFASPNALPESQWVHVGVSVMSSESRNPFFAALFVNGEQVAAQNWVPGATRVFQTNEVIQVGYYARGEQEYFFEGLIDEVRIWGEAKRASDLAAQSNTLLTGQEDGLVALYRMDDIGTMVADATPNAHHGYTTKPLWTLSWAPMLHWQETGVQGFPVDMELSAVDLVPTPADGFEFTLTRLPENGGVFLPDACEEDPCFLTEVDLGAKVFGPLVHYVCDPDFLGMDSFCYAARRINESEWSDSATIDIECVEAPPTGCLEMIDQCGVCGGDGTSCTEGGCDGRGGEIDQCGVCGGDGSSCSCTVYKTYTLSEMDCVLFDHAINRTLLQVETAINTLVDSLDAMMYYSPSESAGISLLDNVDHLCSLDACLSEYEEELEVFDEYISSYLRTHTLCEDSEQEVLEDSSRVMNDHTRTWVRALQS